METLVANDPGERAVAEIVAALKELLTEDGSPADVVDRALQRNKVLTAAAAVLEARPDAAQLQALITKALEANVREKTTLQLA